MANCLHLNWQDTFDHMLKSGLKRSETIRDGKCYFLTWGVHVFRLRVAVCSVADGGFVGVGGELVIQLLGAVDEDGHALHLVTEEEKDEHGMSN